ncbi:MAG: TrkA family potassium uptake protein [Methanomicrobiaceae archaeon]|nr:TrkA family potassium uptake protein [Methanomicrobiaceae archaeon]
MRIIIVGATPIGLDLAQVLIKKGYEVIFIVRDEKIAEKLSESLDCTVINAEGTRPDTLEKAEVDRADAIVACTDHDQDNILIGVVAKGYKVPEIIIMTEDIQFMTVARKLGFHHVLNPPQTTSAIVYHTLRGIDTIELSTMMRGDVRFVSVYVPPKLDGVKLSEIPLPEGSAFIGLYRNDHFSVHTVNPEIKDGDEILIVTRLEDVKDIYDRFRAEEGS